MFQDKQKKKREEKGRGDKLPQNGTVKGQVAFQTLHTYLWGPQPLRPLALHVQAYSLTLFRPISLVTSCKLKTGLYMTLVLFEWDQRFTEITLLISNQPERRKKRQF